MQLLMINPREMQAPDSEIFRPFRTRWIFTFDQADFYVRCYNLTERAISSKKITKARLLELYKGHLRLIDYENNQPAKMSIRWYQFAQAQTKKGIRAILARVNCQRLRLLAGRSSCQTDCCCNCPETRPELVCLRTLQKPSK
jgi:hypothetical protein